MTGQRLLSLALLSSLAGLCVAPATAQTAPSQSAQEPPAQPACVEEVGGRLVVCGEEVVVRANPDEPVRESSVATKIETPLIETPRSVSVIDRQTMEDLGVINLTQVHDYAVGVTLLDERGPIFARGFPLDFYDLRRDGLRTYAWSVREPVALERVQYLRGPAAVLYGDGSPGAVVNMVLKKPLPVRRYEVGFTGGSLGFARVTTDLTGPLTTNRRVRYRIVAAGEWLENGFDNQERRMTLFPTLAVDVGARGTLTFDTEFYDQRGRSYRHVVPATPEAQGGDFSGYPWELNVNSPDDPYGWTGGNVSPGVRFDTGLGRNSSLHVAGRYTKIDGDINAQALSGLTADGRTATRFQYHEVSTWHEFQTDSFVASEVRTGRLGHRLVAGVEAGLSTADSEIGIGAAPPLEISSPTYPSPAEPASRPTRYDVTRLGVYGIDQVRFGEHVIVAPGLRWSHVSIENSVVGVNERLSTQDVVSPSLGLVVLPRPWFSLYTTYAQGFAPPSPGQYLEDGTGLTPSESETIEGGVKTELLDRRISLNAAAFYIERTNVPEADPRGFYRQIGAAASHGFEVEAVGSVTRGLGIRAGYAWTDTEITRDTAGFSGRELPNAPHHKAELWGRYRVTAGGLSGLMVAAGVVAVSAQHTARDNLVTLPAYTRVDASTTYPLGSSGLTVGLIAQNLTDRRYVTSGAGATFFAAPLRRVAVQLNASFD